jgi:hypothetical protein
VALKDTLIGIEKRLERLAGEPPPRDPLEVRKAVLEDILDLCRPAGSGRRVMPFDRVDVEILAPSTDVRRVFEAVFARDGDLETSARRTLESKACEVRPGFAVTLRYRRKAPAGWEADQLFAVTGHAGESAGEASPARAASDTAPLPAAITLRVLAGRAARKTMEFRAERVNIGRGEDVHDRDRRLVRRNDVVFVEGDDASATVSRAHAHLRRGPGGEWRLRDDSSAYGTRIVRAGRTIDVAAGNTRGVRLQLGDELHFGRAVVRVG